MSPRLPLLLCTCLVAASASAADLGARTCELWQLEQWSLANASWSGNPFDLEATVVFTHENGVDSHTSHLYYDGDDHWCFRFTGTRPGAWSFVTSSDDPELDGHSGTITVIPATDAGARGFLVASDDRFARQVGNDGAVAGELLNIYMNLRTPDESSNPGYGHDDHWNPLSIMDDPAQRAAYIQEALDHGSNAIFFQVCNQWFAKDAVGYDDHDSEDPDPATFATLERVIAEAHAEDVHVVLWAWGDEQRKWTPKGVGGINGVPDRRLQRYIAARLAPLPGWSMSYGFDLGEWVSGSQTDSWAAYLHQRMGWPHLLWARKHTGSSLDALSNDDRPEDDFYAVARNRLGKGRPVVFERRFAYLRDGVWDTPTTRRCMWQFAMAGGAVGWWGFYAGKYSQDGPYSDADTLRTHLRFWTGGQRYLLDYTIANERSDGWALASDDLCNFVFYKQDSDSVQVDLQGAGEPLRLVAVNTAAAYTEIDLGTFAPGVHVIDLSDHGGTSDWAIAAGRFAAERSISMRDGPTWTWDCLPIGDDPVADGDMTVFGGLDTATAHRLIPVVDNDG